MRADIKIIHGDSLSELKKLPDQSVNMCMTSPPYWGLRDYGVSGQLGLEPTLLVGKGEMETYKSGKKKAKWFMDAAKAKTPKERARLRSSTFPGIAKAMAEQWG